MNLLQDEEIIKSGSANYMSLIQSKGGKLYLTNQRIIFEGHSFNAGKDFAVINLTDVVTINKTVTMVLFAPIPVPNALKIGTNDGKIYKFTVNKRAEWISIIEDKLGIKCGDDESESKSLNNTKNVKEKFQEVKNLVVGRNDSINSDSQDVHNCGNCGSTIPKTSKFCPVCGYKIEVRNKRKCVNCGIELEDNARFCPSCGTEVCESKQHCPKCGVEIKKEQKFCLECGKNLEEKDD